MSFAVEVALAIDARRRKALFEMTLGDEVGNFRGKDADSVTIEGGGFCCADRWFSCITDTSHCIPVVSFASRDLISILCVALVSKEFSHCEFFSSVLSTIDCSTIDSCISLGASCF